MRELQVLGNGPLKLDLADCQEFFEQDLTEMVRSQLKLLIEQALCAERDHYPQLGYYEHAPVSRLDYRNGVYFRDLTTKLGVLAAHWKKVRTANLIERAFREVRRRARPMSNFCNTESCDRIVYGVISNLNRSWERKPLPEFTQST